jgi:toxin FitB
LSYLVDTNVLSELRRKNPDAGVVAWFSNRPAVTLYLSVLTLGEIRKGVDGLTDETRKLALLDWLEVDLPAFFSGRILPVDARVADRWGRLIAAAGRPVPAIDSLLAATAVEHDLTLVTRNVKDFSDMPVQTINPWTSK